MTVFLAGSPAPDRDSAQMKANSLVICQRAVNKQTPGIRADPAQSKLARTA
jgi:hypothetical protein